MEKAVDGHDLGTHVELRVQFPGGGMRDADTEVRGQACVGAGLQLGENRHDGESTAPFALCLFLSNERQWARTTVAYLGDGGTVGQALERLHEQCPQRTQALRRVDVAGHR